MTPAQARRVKALRNVLKSSRPKSEIEKLCIVRMIDDHKLAKSRGLIWNEQAAQDACGFYSGLRHWKGQQFAGKPITLEPWQSECLIAPQFGWYRANGTRRFNFFYFEIPRKNGKTLLICGVALFGLIADGEAGAEIYSAATKRDQSLIMWRDAKKSIGAYKSLVDMTGGKRDQNASIQYAPLNSTFVPLASDSDSLDGLNVHMGLLDELHAHKDGGLYDVLETGTGSRLNPVVGAITTSGVDRGSVCWEKRQILVDIIEGNMLHDAYHGFISTIDEGDDWEDPANWLKANPNLGVSISLDRLEANYRSSKVSGRAQNNFRRKHLNQWVGQAARWIDVERWDHNKVELTEIDLEGPPCWIGIDLGESRDVSAMAILWHIGEKYYLRIHYWAPEDSINERAFHDRRQVKQWMDKGLVTALPGDRTDQEIVTHQMVAILTRYNWRAICFDPWHSTEMVYHIKQLLGLGDNDIRLARFRQTIANFAPACRSFEEMIYKGRLIHDGHPVTRWQIGNLAIRQDVSGNIRPDKDKSADKIDGPVAALMALGEAVHGEMVSFYEDSELESD